MHSFIQDIWIDVNGSEKEKHQKATNSVSNVVVVLIFPLALFAQFSFQIIRFNFYLFFGFLASNNF